MLKMFLNYYKNHWKLFTAELSCAVLMSGLDLIYPMFIQQLIDQYFPARNLNMMIRISVILLVIYLLRFIFQYIVHYWGHVVGIRMETDMRSDLFTHLQKLSFKFFDNNKVGYLMSRVVNDLNNISELAHHGPEDVLISAMLLVGSFTILINMHWQLALVTFALIPIMFFFSKKLGEKMYHAFKVIREKMAEVNTIVEDSLSGIRVVKSFTNEDYENEKFCEGNHNYRRSREWAMKNMAQFHSGMNLFINLIRLSTLAAGGYFIYNGSLTAGQMVAFLFYVDMFMNPIRRLVNFNEQLQRGMSGFSRFKELLEVDPEIVDRAGARELKNVEGLIKYEDVTFGYDNHGKVLTNIDIEIEPGKTVAFVGPSGAGKSTLTKLLPRFYEIDNGRLSIDNLDIRDITLESLRRNIGIVQQDVFLFNGTVRENIAYGMADAAEAEIIEAAEKANAHDFILNLSQGYNTDIGERGVKLSGGQKQRISIARSFLKNPPILILDEATSSLDNRSEKIIQESLEKLAEGRTTLVIAHRLSTVINADQIIVLTENGIVERGKHEELIKNGGEYAQLYNEQFSAELAG
ncbi:ATP-binding cassette subfamily B protein [Halanaerobium saccharolyticum]|uniref:ATP-binding cassette subfamily B protein n=1 Tax=Halanaerobium saccharolyticum TaxID=43595 RepID=A0A4R7YVD3_9FIRM|nr:ABC transporter ATP-binding protein [Halanaerobium saccharolyticum]RAK06625.1 ATP-binding cassette subfamily B protein [Halanaerobium saccharolyticum]TDW01164.1 ATP-binding cassette subfamily B protein [Halanaerobium saccharolyticum]TDX51215.1 ATP-binding cassette subfamily B protein [Halanaerobium saccharolyticum]